MDAFIRTISVALQESSGIAIGAALLWGGMSIILSPCNIVAIPLIVGYVDSQSAENPRKALLLSSLFGVGILVNLLLIGGLIATAGHFLSGIGSYLNYLVAAILVVVGLHLLEVITIPWFAQPAVETKRSGAMGALVLGLVSGLAVGPCSFAYVAPVMVLVLKIVATQPVFSMLLLFAYAAGVALVIIAVGTFAGFVQRFMQWDERSRGTLWINRVCGVLIILAGVYFIYEA
ncbi:MAG: cytochrome c biogenesis protein CcdA [Synergistales bacterium]|nr:cytochrome c biogenesis protein CcdA [Synergistales bacterium]